MIRLHIRFKAQINSDLWNEISALIFKHHSTGIDEGEHEPEHLLLQAADEFLAAIEPVILSSPKQFHAYFESHNIALQCKTALESNYNQLIAMIELQEEPDQDYSKTWRENFHPIVVNQDITIRAPWHSKTLTHKYEIIIEPGMAFGTGTHETTKTCIELMQTIFPKSSTEEILDFGCGSGILAIAAKLLGAKNVYGVDIDPLSIESSIQNSQLNQTQIEVNLDYEKLSIFQKQNPPYFDGIIANILKNTLLEFSDRLNLWLKPKGFLILSGILKEQADEISHFFKAKGFIEKNRITRIDSTLKDHAKFSDQIWEWTSLLLIKN